MTPPSIRPWQIKRDGNYYRNLSRNEVAKRYERDEDAQPEFGYKLKKTNKWRWTARDGQEGLSTNLTDCISSPICSILLHPNSDNYNHVVEIRLPQLSMAIAMALVAQYTPDQLNKCHFNVLPLEDDIDSVQRAIEDLLTRDFPPSRLPTSPKQVEQARIAKSKFDSVFMIHRNCRDN